MKKERCIKKNSKANHIRTSTWHWGWWKWTKNQPINHLWSNRCKGTKTIILLLIMINIIVIIGVTIFGKEKRNSIKINFSDFIIKRNSYDRNLWQVWITRSKSVNTYLRCEVVVNKIHGSAKVAQKHSFNLSLCPLNEMTSQILSSARLAIQISLELTFQGGTSQPSSRSIHWRLARELLRPPLLTHWKSTVWYHQRRKMNMCKCE